MIDLYTIYYYLLAYTRYPTTEARQSGKKAAGNNHD